MQTITTIGSPIITKSVFQVHGVDNEGKVVIRRQLKRRYVLAIGVCGNGASRICFVYICTERRVRASSASFIPPFDVKAYVGRRHQPYGMAKCLQLA